MERIQNLQKNVFRFVYNGGRSLSVASGKCSSQGPDPKKEGPRTRLSIFGADSVKSLKHFVRYYSISIQDYFAIITNDNRCCKKQCYGENLLDSKDILVYLSFI